MGFVYITGEDGELIKVHTSQFKLPEGGTELPTISYNETKEKFEAMIEKGCPFDEPNAFNPDLQSDLNSNTK